MNVIYLVALILHEMGQVTADLAMKDTVVLNVLIASLDTIQHLVVDVYHVNVTLQVP